MKTSLPHPTATKPQSPQSKPAFGRFVKNLMQKAALLCFIVAFVSYGAMAQTENFNIPGTTTWTVPAIGTITGGQGTNHITFTALTKGTGQVCVQVTNLTCTGVPSCITIDIKEVPAIPVFKQN